mgnify:CR=1
MRENELSTLSDAFCNAYTTWYSKQAEQGRHDSLDARFSLWLLAQGARLDKSLRPGNLYAVTLANVCPGADILVFDSAEQLTYFVLKYSK